MLRILFILFLLNSAILLRAQNLVPNPGFENYNTCPSNNIFTAANWYNPNTASPDYFNPCGSGWTAPGSSVLFGPQTARTGNSFAGAGWYNLAGGWYDYIQVQLISSLTPGDSYTVSMWVNLADGVKKASDDMGIYISATPFKSTSTILPSITTIVPTTPANFGVFTTLTPQIKFSDGNFISDVNNWTLISGTYVAIGGEQTITIGCFEPWATTGTQLVNAGASNDRCYYYIDDVSVEKIPLPIELLSFEATHKENNSIQLNWETLSETNSCFYEIQRSDDAQNFHAIDTVKAAGNSNSIQSYQYKDVNPLSHLVYYRIKQLDCDGSFSYTKIVAVNNSNEISVSVYPNPVFDELIVSMNDQKEYSVPMTIQNTLGENIFAKELNDQVTSFSFYNYEKGVYIISFTNQNGEVIRKKIIKQ